MSAAAILAGIKALLQFLSAFVQWRANAQLLEAGRAEANAATASKAAEKIDAMAKIAANPASDDAVAGSLQRGDF